MAVNYTLYGGKQLPTPGSDADFYMKQNPDVWGAYNEDTGMNDPDLFAKTHYDRFGVNEGRIFGNANATPNSEQTGGSVGGGTSTPSPTSMFGDELKGLKKGSYSGLPPEYQQQLLKDIIPRLLDSFKNYRSDIDQSTKAAQDLYGQMSRGAMKEGAQGILQDLANRNIFKGNVVDDAYAKGMSRIADQYANKGFESAMAGSAMKANEPSMLGQVAGLGSSSESFNELAPYELLSHFYLNTQ
jgi:hypothetical protein